MESIDLLIATALAGGTLAGGYALWTRGHRLQAEAAARERRLQKRIDRLDSRVTSLEQEVSRQAVEIEEMGIRVETRAYWDE